jgi:hypothetical protein
MLSWAPGTRATAPFADGSTHRRGAERRRPG